MKSFSFSCLGTTFQCKGLLAEDVLKTFFWVGAETATETKGPYIYLAGVLWPVTYAHIDGCLKFTFGDGMYCCCPKRSSSREKRAPLLSIKSCIRLCFVLCAEYRVDAEFSLSTRTFYRLVWTQEAFMRSRHYCNFMLHEVHNWSVLPKHEVHKRVGLESYAR